MSGPVVFEGSVLGRGPVTGVGRAFLTTLRAYTALTGEESLLLLPERVPAPEIPGLRVLRCTGRSLGKQLRLPLLLRRLRARVLHSPVAAIPVLAPCPVVATVHDLPWMSPGLPRERGHWRGRLGAAVAARRARAIVVPSSATLRDLQAFTRSGPRVQLVPHGVERPAHPAREQDLRGPLLVLGDDRPRKNHARLRRAHRRARVIDPDLPELCFVGPPRRYVTEAEKLRLLRSCRGLVHATLLEGFGLPVLEAMAHGVPVLAADRGSLPEVSGDAALLVDPEDETAIAEGMVRLHRDASLRRELRERGLSRASEYPPERTAMAWRQLHLEIGP